MYNSPQSGIQPHGTAHGTLLLHIVPLPPSRCSLVQWASPPYHVWQVGIERVGLADGRARLCRRGTVSWHRSIGQTETNTKFNTMSPVLSPCRSRFRSMDS
ncbi:hypothetical protein CCM_01356 [Cordyceps militaris CM01]|uniref:Uncharacterized protein n=1 Tax=Cordyceps militaris (strain CM01) TaxID=983644 RepID=G3J4N3_CORMM|nr:uncharacterized protein CCM_01356 [Cordyceps militaris CM01]EGX96698.1 hypothetical protein CCM_01356 [Cordyceps militaris CM01]